MTPFRFRPATEADFDGLVALSVRVMREHLERVGRFDPARRRTRMRLHFERGFLRVIEADGATLGCVGVEERADHIEIHSLFLDPPAQGRGLGERVFAAILAEHPGRVVRLEVLKGSPARRFWERQGFVQAGEKAFDWVMERGG